MTGESFVCNLDYLEPGPQLTRSCGRSADPVGVNIVGLPRVREGEAVIIIRIRKIIVLSIVAIRFWSGEHIYGMSFFGPLQVPAGSIEGRI